MQPHRKDKQENEDREEKASIFEEVGRNKSKPSRRLQQDPQKKRAHKCTRRDRENERITANKKREKTQKQRENV